MRWSLASEPAAQRVGQQLGRERPCEGVRLLFQYSAQLRGACELPAARGAVPVESIGNLPSSVRHAPMPSKFSRPKPSGSIRRWHEAHVGSLRCRLHLLAQRRRGAHGRFVQARHRRGRRRRRGVQQVLEDPLAAKHRRGPRRVGRHREHARLHQHAFARRVAQIDSPELGAHDARQPVVAGEPLVDERVLRVQELQDAAVLANDRREEEIRFLPHRLAEVVLEVGELVGVGLGGFERTSLQPLPAELLDQRLRLRIAQHARHLRAQHAWRPQCVRRGEPAQLGVRRARPEEVRQPRRQLVVRHRLRRSVRRGSRPLEPEQEIR